MAVRIALQCSEADSYVILSEENSAARLLSRPGEAIYNDANGAVEGNNPFQVAWLPDAERDRILESVRTAADERGWKPPTPQIVFEGAAPGDIANNALVFPLRAAEDGVAATRRSPAAFLGEPVAIKDPTGAALRRQNGSNLIVLGQRDEAARGW